jgi:hypothetical protein
LPARTGKSWRACKRIDLPAFIVYFACMKTNGCQYTIRQIPRAVDKSLRRKSRREGKSLNTVAIEALSTGLQIGGEPIRHHDLDFMAGSWIEDKKFDEAIAAQDCVDPSLWR